MRNLKRALSLALASVMLLGMMVVGTGAASYADVDSADNVEAIEVIKAIGVMTGDTNGNFNPDQKVTRGEMAVVMTNMLGLDVNDYAGTNLTFTDVPDWGKGFVAACLANGIAAGYNDKQFGFNDSVTTAQAALMMMKALGYFQYTSDFGSDWQLATVKQGSKIDLFKGIESGATVAMTRNDVAQIALNTLKANTVEAVKSGSTIITGDVTIIGEVKYEYVLSTASYADDFGDAVVTGTTSYAVQLGEKLYKGDLKLTASQQDDFKRPGKQWTYKGENVAFSANEATNVAVVNKSGKTVAQYVTDVLKKTYTYANSGTVVSVNGAAAVANTYALKVGSTIEFYMNATTANQVDRVVVIEPTVYTLTADAATKVVDNETRVIVPGVTGMGGYVAANTTKTVVGYEGLKKGDVVLAYKGTETDGDGKVTTYITKAASVTGTVTGMQDGTKLVVNGTAYANSGLANANNSWSADYTNEYTFYLDGANNIIKAEKNTNKATDNYAFVLESAWVTGTELGQTNYGQVRLLMPDGTNKIVTVSKVDGKDAVQGTGGAAGKVSADHDTTTTAIDNAFVTYKVDSKGKYELTEKTTGSLTAAALVGNKANFNGSYIGNNNTIFLVNTKTASDPEIKVYTGIANMPSITAVAATDKVFVDNGIAKFVYIKVASSSIQGSDGQYVYIPGTGDNYNTMSYTYVPESESGKGDDYYQFNAIVNGKTEQVKLDAINSIVNTDGTPAADANLAVNTLYKVMSTDSNGIITLVSSYSTDVPSSVGVEVTGGVLKTTGASYIVNNNTEVYYIDHTGAVTELNAADVSKDSTDKVYVTKTSDSNKVADQVIIVEDIKATTQITGFTYVIDGVETKVTQTINASGSHVIKNLAGKGGKTVTITDITCADEGIWAVSGSATVKATGASDASSSITVTVTAENGTTTATMTIGFQVDA